jgi:hypothetical protein
MSHSSNSLNKKSHGKIIRQHSKFHDTQGLFTEDESIHNDEDESMGRQNPNHEQYHQSINSVTHSEVREQ